MFLHRRLSTSHNRTASVISTSTDHELCAIAELMSPVVEVQSDFAEQQELLGTAIDDELDAFIEPSIYHELANPLRSKRSGYCLDGDSEISPYPPPSPLSNRNSVYSDCQSELDLSSDNEVVYPPKPSPYPAFHLPRPRPRPVSIIRDSDTPSLSSSTSYSSLASLSRSHSRRNSPPISPASLLTPVEYQPSGPHLEIIEERYVEDLDIQQKISVESAGGQGAIKFAVPKSPSPAIVVNEGNLPEQDIPTLKRRMPHIEHLRLKGISPSLRTRSQSPTSRSPLSSDSGTLSPGPQTAPLTRHRVGSAVSISRFLGGGSKAEKPAAIATTAERNHWSPATPSPSFTSFYDDGVKSPKQEEKRRKAEEKQRKKDEAKAKTEQLALDLKEKARKREAAKQRASMHSGKSNDKRPVWADGPSMFGGLGSL